MSKKPIRKAGFTLVEVIIVLAILVLLAAMVGPRLLKTQSKADIQATIAQISNLESSLKFYSIDNRTFPSTEEGLQALLTKPADENRARNWNGSYLDADRLPADPWGNAFQYEYPPSRGARDLPNIWSWGPDGKDATEDDIVNWTKTSGDGSEGQPAAGGSTSAATATNPATP